MASKASDFFTSLNPFMAKVLASRFHWPFSTQIALVTFTGKKSGRTFTTPMAYHDFGETIIIALAETQGRNWWRNYIETAPMDMLIKGKNISGFASVLTPESSQYKQWFEAVLNRSSLVSKVFLDDYNAQQGLSEAQIQAIHARSGLVKFTRKREDHP
jgi:hypothetical protein